mgnify:CR=1 FL=1
MTRQIKFRGRTCSEKSRWMYGYLVHNGSFWYTQEGIISQGVEEDSIGQFTGLLDKNGKEIYEGDIVKTRELNRVTDPTDYGVQGLMLSVPQVVKFENCGFHPLNGWVAEALKDMEWKIIGNIYQNPELLKN